MNTNLKVQSQRMPRNLVVVRNPAAVRTPKNLNHLNRNAKKSPRLKQRNIKYPGVRNAQHIKSVLFV